MGSGTRVPVGVVSLLVVVAVLSGTIGVGAEPTATADVDANPVDDRNTKLGHGQTNALQETQTGNQPPIARAGPDRFSEAGESVALDGTESTDPDGDSLSYRWM